MMHFFYLIDGLNYYIYDMIYIRYLNVFFLGLFCIF